MKKSAFWAGAVEIRAHENMLIRCTTQPKRTTSLCGCFLSEHFHNLSHPTATLTFSFSTPKTISAIVMSKPFSRIEIKRWCHATNVILGESFDVPRKIQFIDDVTSASCPVVVQKYSSDCAQDSRFLLPVDCTTSASSSPIIKRKNCDIQKHTNVFVPRDWFLWMILRAAIFLS